jgi:hypothetical protein
MKKVPLAAIVVGVGSAFSLSVPRKPAQTGSPTASASNSRFAIILSPEKTRPSAVNVDSSHSVFNPSVGQARLALAVTPHFFYQDVFRIQKFLDREIKSGEDSGPD